MFNEWTGLGAMFATRMPAGQQLIPGGAVVVDVIGAPPGEGLLVEKKRNGVIFQPSAWEGIRADDSGHAAWSFNAPTEAGLYTYTILAPVIGSTTDEKAILEFRVGAPSVAVDNDIVTTSQNGGGGAGQAEVILEEGGGFKLPENITILGVTLSPLMLAGAGIAAYFLLKGRR